MENNIHIQIVYADPEQQVVVNLAVPAGTTIHQALVLSELIAKIPGLDIRHAIVGVFSVKKRLSDVLQGGDRVELYRPLLRDPKKIIRDKTK